MGTSGGDGTIGRLRDWTMQVLAGVVAIRADITSEHLFTRLNYRLIKVYEVLGVDFFDDV